MKQLNETFTDKEHKYLVKLKERMTWRQFILLMARVYENEEKKVK